MVKKKKEYDEHAAIREKVSVHSWTYDPELELEWYMLREAYSDELDQMTVTYWLFSPGKGEKGDIGAFAEIYNPEGTSWNNRDFSEMVVEISKFDWAKVTVEVADGRSWEFPAVGQDDIPSVGYMTFRVPLE